MLTGLILRQLYRMIEEIHTMENFQIQKYLLPVAMTAPAIGLSSTPFASKTIIVKKASRTFKPLINTVRKSVQNR